MAWFDATDKSEGLGGGTGRKLSFTGGDLAVAAELPEAGRVASGHVSVASCPRIDDTGRPPTPAPGERLARRAGGNKPAAKPAGSAPTSLTVDIQVGTNRPQSHARGWLTAC